jgi:hypothetical protein
MKSNVAEFFTLTNILFGVGMLHKGISTFRGKVGGIKVLAGPAPTSQTIGSLLRSLGKIKQEVIWRIHFNVKYTRLFLTQRIWQFHVLTK